MIPASVIEDIKYRNSIEDVISSYVNLTRSGANLKGLCPFHSEKTPSFTVYTGDGHFYCFGCGAGGDVISFIMRIENLDYRGALEFLARRCGITLPEDDGGREKGGVSRNRVLEMNLCAAKFFRNVLFSPEGQAGQEYFAKRQLSGATIKHFGLGYAPNSYDALKKHLHSQGFTDEEMVAGYLCQRSKKNEKNTYDCFRNRVMFPIIDTAGNIVAFGGRVLDDSKPKYLNSSDTPAFRKSRHLFALNYAKNHTEDGFILCEGYMDVIALHAAGFENAVATLGTAITADHARIMKKYTDKVTISYDSDDAGQKAADKALRLLGEAGIEARVLTIPGAKDPDEYIKSYGREKFAEVLRGSRSGFEHKIHKVLAKYDLNDLNNADIKARAARELCYAIADTESKVERDIYCQRIASVLNVDISSIKSEVTGILRHEAAKRKKERHTQVVRITSGSGDRVDPDFVKAPGNVRLEGAVIGMLLLHKEYIAFSKDKSILSPEMFTSELNRRLYEKITGTPDFDFGMLSEDFTQDEVSRAAKMMSDRKGLSNSKEVFTDCAVKLREMTEKLKEKQDGADLRDIIERRRKEATNNRK